MVVNVAGLVSILVFYAVILGVGVWAAWYKRKRSAQGQSETTMVAGRDLGLLLGCFTMTATWVGGGYINGTAESVYTPGFGLLWTTPPFCYSLAVLFGGIFFAKPMREQGYVTMIDPFQRKLGRRMGGLLTIPALCSETFFAGAILAALGGTLTVIVGLREDVAIIISACIAVVYTLVGGLYSVAFTDVAQLICMIIGLWLSVPFAFTNEAVQYTITETAYSNSSWLGNWNSNFSGLWFDTIFQLIGGGIPWQCYFQRVLAADTVYHAQLLSVVGCFGCIIMSVPSILIGALATSTNWTATAYGPLTPNEKGQQAMILPIVLQYMTPTVVSFLGLGAVAAAVMSSTDSSILALASMTTRNLYQPLLRPKASEKELVWVLRISTVLSGIVPTILAIEIKSVFALWSLCTDLCYVLLLPQLISVVYFDVNTYGSLLAFPIGLILRIGGGEILLDLPPFIQYPGNDYPYKKNFPVKTFAMLVSLFITLSVSWLAKYVFERGILPPSYDVLGCKLAEGGRSKNLKTDVDSKSETDAAFSLTENVHA